jgi:hypothetical protein
LDEKERKKERKKDYFNVAIGVNYGVALFLSWYECKYVGFIWLHLLIGHLYLIGVWLGEDQQTNEHHTCTCFNNVELRLQVLSTAPHSIMNTIGRVYVFS